MTDRIVVIGVGNTFRHDDGAGPALVDRLREPVAAHSGVVLEVTDGEPTRLRDLWDGASTAVVVDAVRENPPRPGHVHELVVDRMPPEVGSTTSHGVGLGTAVELGILLGRMPQRLVLYAISGADFTVGVGLSPPVAAALDEVASRILELPRLRER